VSTLEVDQISPTVKVGCPCIRSFRNNEAEEITPDWAAAGTDVLFHAVLETAGVVG
jgi:N-carbamoyl-L-amino-acid hydrolase